MTPCKRVRNNYMWGLVFVFLLVHAPAVAKPPVNVYKFFFENPINLNAFRDSELKMLLRALRVKSSSVRQLFQYLRELKSRQQSLQDLNELRVRGILSPRDVELLARFSVVGGRKDSLFLDPEPPSDDDDDDEPEDDDESSSLDVPEEIDLNECTDDELDSVLSPTQIQALNAYRHLYTFRSVYELLLIVEIPVAQFLKIQHMFTPLSQDRPVYSLRTRYKSSDQHLKPYFSTYFSVRPYKNVLFFLSAVTRDTDSPYYPFGPFSKKAPLALYRQYSIGFHAENLSDNIFALAAGDYHLRLGQHLVFGKPFRAFLSDRVSGSYVYKKNRGVSPASSPLRTGALRGVALGFSFGNFRVLPFSFFNVYELDPGRFSRDAVHVSYERLVTNPSYSYSQKQDARKLTELGFGVQFAFERPQDSQVALNIGYFRLSRVLHPRTRAVNAWYEFRSDSLLNSSLSGAVYRGSVKFCSEIAVSRFVQRRVVQAPVSDVACVGCFVWSITDSWTYSMSLRYVGKSYYAPHSSPSFRPRNARFGVLQGLGFSGKSPVKGRVYFDVYRRGYAPGVHVHADGYLVYALLSNFDVSTRFMFKYTPASTRRLYYGRGRLEFAYAVSSVFAVKLLFERVYARGRSPTSSALSERFRVAAEYADPWVRLVVYQVFYRAERGNARIVVNRVLPHRWYLGPKVYAGRGMEYGLSVDVKVFALTIGFAFEIDARRLSRYRRQNKTTLLQLRYSW